ncbi:MAG: PLP-dependent aminotransferase family protein [Lachnospiraceae bacterium]|nr:PLP-dependent aminotransferase family protein [Lachnospiraceae bacterium]
MLTYSLEGLGSETLYEHLYRMIRRDIRSGALKAGEALPSKRSFARQLGISIVTVENAYAQLQMEGYIEAVPRKGFYVADLGQEEFFPAPEMSPAVAGETEATRQEPDWFADFSGKQTHADNFPFTTWARVSREVLSTMQEELMENAPAGGIMRLRCRIAEHLRQFRGMEVRPEQILIGAGTDYLYGLLIQLLGTNVVYASENPGYRKLVDVLGALGAEVRLIGLDHKGIRVNELESSGAQVVHVTPSHHFPTGITMPAARRFELLGWAKKQPDRYIIEDDYDSEFRMNGKPLPALFSEDRAGRVIYMNTFTKTLASTIRIGYMVLPLPLLERFRARLSFYSCSVSNFEQYTLARFMEKGCLERHISRVRNASRRKRDWLMECMARSGMDDMVEISEENAGLHFIMKLKVPVEPVKLEEQLRSRGIRLPHLEQYWIGEMPDPMPKQSQYLVNYAEIPMERIEEAVQRISEAMKQ